MRYQAVPIVVLGGVLLGGCGGGASVCGQGQACPTTSSSASGTGGSGPTGSGGAGGVGGGGGGLPGGVFAVAGIDPSLPAEELAPFDALLGSTPMVGLGESVHTSGGYLTLKARLIRHLVQDRGFRALAMETPHTDAESVGAYVASDCSGDVTAAMKGMTWVFASDSTRDLVAWMCQYNQGHPSDPVRLVGFDAQQPWSDWTNLKAFLESAAPADAAALVAGLSTCNGAGFTTAKDYFTSGAYTAPFPQAAFDGCTTGIDALDAYLAGHAAGLTAASSAGALGWANIASIGLRSWQGQQFYQKTQVGTSYASRDVAMASILERTRDLAFPGAKTIVWAHNVHLAERHTEVTGEPQLGPFTTMGTVLKQDLGDAYQAFALIGYDVHTNWPEVGPASTPKPKDPGSLELMLHGLGRDALFIDHEAAGASGFLDPTGTYQVGTPSPAPMLPARQFRGAFYLDVSLPMNPLFPL